MGLYGNFSQINLGIHYLDNENYNLRKLTYINLCLHVCSKCYLGELLFLNESFPTKACI